MTPPRRIAGIFALIVLIPFMGLAAYGVVLIYPHLDDTRQLIAAEPDVPPGLYDLAIRAESRVGTQRYTGRLLAWHYAPEARCAAVYWAMAAPRLYSERELFKLWVRLAPYGHGQGLRAAARYFYGKTLDELNERQLAELVVMVRSPSRFPPGSPRSRDRVEKLLAVTYPGGMPGAGALPSGPARDLSGERR